MNDPAKWQSNSVIVLNADFGLINLISWKRAVQLLLKNKAEIVEATAQMITSSTREITFAVPKVIRLVTYIKKIHKAQVAFNKSNVLTRDKRCCAYCSSKEHLTVDHIVPVSKGGPSNWLNCVACCKSCNSTKGNQSLAQAGMALKIKPYAPSYMQFLSIKASLLTS